MHATTMISIKIIVKAQNKSYFLIFYISGGKWPDQQCLWDSLCDWCEAVLFKITAPLVMLKNMSLSLCLATDRQYETYPWQRRKCAAGCRRSRSDRSSELLPLPVRCSAASCTGPEALETHKHSQRFHLCMWLRAITVKNILSRNTNTGHRCLAIKNCISEHHSM